MPDVVIITQVTINHNALLLKWLIVQHYGLLSISIKCESIVK